MGKLTVMKFKTKRRVKNIDQIFEDLSTEKSVHQYKNQPLQEDKPGLGQHYCIECANYYQSEHALFTHRKSKVHKRRAKLIKEGPYTQLEADAAAGNDLQKYLAKNSANSELLKTRIGPMIQLEKGKDQLKKSKKPEETLQKPEEALQKPTAMEIEA